MLNDSLLHQTKDVVCSPDAAGATTDLDGVVIDMAQDEGYDGINVVAALGDVADTCVLNLKLMGSLTSDGASPVLVAETGTFTAGAATADDKLMVLDVTGPGYRYVFSRLVRGTANAAVNAVVAKLYKARKKFVTPGTDVIKYAYTPGLG